MLNCYAQQYSSLINAVLTILLVGVTAWYALVTRKMWREMAESRLAGIRPLLSLSLGFLEKKQPPAGNESLFMGPLKIFNFGRGPAYTIQVSLSIPSEHRKDDSRAVVQNQRSPEPALLPTSSTEFMCSIYNHGAAKGGPEKHFLDLLCQYRDGEGNYYSVLQQYSYLPLSIPSGARLELLSEEIRFTPFSRHKHQEPRTYPSHLNMDLVVSQETPRENLHDFFK